MKIIKEIRDSIYSKTYYQFVISKKDFKSSLSYLYKLVLIISIITTIAFIVKIPSISTYFKNTISKIVNDYPEDLLINFKDGVASINKPEPYEIPLPNDLISKQSDESGKIENLIVVNTKESFSTNTFLEYSTFALITKTDLVMVKDRNSLQITPLSKIGNAEITKDFLIKTESKILKILPYLYFVIPLGLLLLSFIGILIGTAFMLLMYALVVWIIAKVKKVDLSYKKSYQVGIHIATSLVIIEIFTILIGINYPPIYKIIIFAIITFINLPSGNDKPEVVPQE